MDRKRSYINKNFELFFEISRPNIVILRSKEEEKTRLQYLQGRTAEHPVNATDMCALGHGAASLK
jgi:hypothetical protein